MDFRRLQTFRTVAALLSFSGAAELLHCTQSTVSSQIRTLEDDLGVPLFLRQGTGVVLTPAGETYLAYAGKLLALQEEAVQRAREERQPAATLSLRMPQSLAEAYLPQIIAAFQPDHPRVGLDVAVCGFSVLEAELRTGLTDLAFLLCHDLATPGLVTTRLATRRLVFVAGPRTAAATTSFGWTDLANCCLFTPKHDCSYRMEVEQELQSRGLHPCSLIQCNSLTMLRRCVAQDLGVALVPAFAVRDDLAQGTLVPLPWREKPLTTGLLMFRHRDAAETPERRDFLALCTEIMGRDDDPPVIASHRNTR